jgi:hypothetical protein
VENDDAERLLLGIGISNWRPCYRRQRLRQVEGIQVAKNLRVVTGRAGHGKPVIQRVIEVR